MTTEVIPEERALAPIEHSGLVVGGAFADLSDEEFGTRLAALQKQQRRIAQVKKSVMVRDEDYGLVPGTDRPVLLKGGAEKLCNLNGLVARLETTRTIGDGFVTPTLTYETECWLHVGSFAGPAVGYGQGVATSWEKKYRYVNAGVVCPDCGRGGVIKTSRGQYWHPVDAKPEGGCNGNFKLDDERLANQKPTKVDDPDPWDKANTLLKMSEKRSHVDATLRATGTSGLFTQDLEENAPPPPPVVLPPDDDWSMMAFKNRMKFYGIKMGELKPTAEALGFTGQKLEDLTDEERRDFWTAFTAESDEDDEDEITEAMARAVSDYG